MYIIFLLIVLRHFQSLKLKKISMSFFLILIFQQEICFVIFLSPIWIDGNDNDVVIRFCKYEYEYEYNRVRSKLSMPQKYE